jgi:hypothetical protein
VSRDGSSSVGQQIPGKNPGWILGGECGAREVPL